MDLLLGVGGTMQKMRRVRSCMQSEAITKKPKFSSFQVEFFSGRHDYNA